MGHVDQIGGKPRLREDPLHHGQVASGAAQARLERTAHPGLERLDKGENLVVEVHRKVILHRGGHRLNLLPLLLRLLGREVAGDVLQLVLGGLFAAGLSALVKVPFQGVDVFQQLFIGRLQVGVRVDLRLAAQRRVHRLIEIVPRLVVTSCFVGF